MVIAQAHRAQTEELRQQLKDSENHLDACYEATEVFRNDYYECQRLKGFEWKEDMKLVCSHFTEED